MRNAYAAALALLCFCAVSSWAQVGLGTSVTPDSLGYGYGKMRKEIPPPVDPLAIAMTLAFDDSTWTQIHASTATALQLTGMMRKGYYRMELIQLVLIAQKADAPFDAIEAEREKGDKLRDIAQRHKLDYDAIYDQSLGIQKLVLDRYLPSVMAISVATSPPAGWKPKRRPLKKPQVENP